jgi:2-keto-3-deoxy-6-phosphogluconate aldolase
MAAAPATAETVYERIRRVRLVPVIRVQDSATALGLVDRLLAADLDVIEVTTTIDEALDQ